MPDPDTTLLAVEPTAKRVFELFVDTLVVERDTADAALLTRLKWYGEDVSAAHDRLTDDPRSARALIHQLSGVMRTLELDAVAADLLEENVHQGRRWVLVLPEISLDNGTSLTDAGHSLKVDPS